MKGPLDRRVDRRAFLARAAALSAAVSGPLPAVAATPAPRPSSALPFVEPRPEAAADPTELTVVEATTLIRRGELAPEELMRAHLARIAAHEDVYRAFNLVRTQAAAAEAREAGRRPPRGLLHGIPLAVKDNFFTAGTRTTANSFLFQDFVPPYDATAVARLRRAGAIVLGKAQMGPLASTRATEPNGLITTVNAWAPHDPAVDPGASSSGTATAVAGRLATSGTGTQTGGSITGPSNAQNLTGLKPTMGRVSLYGIVPLSYTRDHPGPLARDALDAAVMLSVMAGPDRHDHRTQGLPPVPDLIESATPVRRRGRVALRWPTRIGVVPGYLSGADDTTAARKRFLDTLDTIPGASLVDVPLPAEWDLLTGNAFNNVRLPERSEAFLPQLRRDLRAFGVSVIPWLEGALLGGGEFLTGQRTRLLLLERVLDGLFARCDIVVQTDPVPFDILGLPELALPIGFDGAGLPTGTVLGGLPYAEDRLLSVAAAYQARTDWHRRRPTDPAKGEGTMARGRGRIDAVQVARTTC